MASNTPQPRPVAGEEAGAIGGKGSGAYAEALGRGLFALAAPSGKLTPRRIKAMRDHYQLAACLLVLTLPLIDADSTVECDDPDIAETLSDSWDLKRLDVMRSFAKSLTWGYSPNTLRWNDVQLPSGSAFVVDKIRDLDPEYCQVIEDADSAYAGILQSPPSLDPITLDVPWQTLWMTSGMENGNLYGRSLLQAALAPWKSYLAADVWHMRYLERFGEPVVRVRHPSGGERVLNAEDINAAIQWNLDHPTSPIPVPDPISETNQHTATRLGEGLANHSVVTLNSEQTIGPEGKSVGYAWDVDFLESAKNGGADFVTKLNDADRSMARALFIPDTLFANPDTGTYALGRQHRSIFDSSTEGRLADAARQITAYVIDRERIYNFGENAPPARLVFGGVTDVNRDKLWGLAQTLVDGQRLPIDVERLGADLGIPLLSAEEQADADTASGAGGVAASPFSTVGLPSLTAAGILTIEEARGLLGLDGTGDAPAEVPDEPAPVDPAADEETLGRAAHAITALHDGQPLTGVLRAAVRTALGLATERDRVEVLHKHEGHDNAAHLAAAPVGDTSTLPGYEQPQVGGGGFRRDLTPREKRVPFAKLEASLDSAEASAIEQLVEILGISRIAVLKQIAGILAKPTRAEQIEAIDTLDDARLGTKVASVWETLIRAVWLTGLDSVREEIAAVSVEAAASVPVALGAEARAIAKVQARSAATAQAAKLLGSVRAAMLNAVRSGVTRAGVEAEVSAIYEKETTSEAATPRLSTRTLSAQAMNGGRQDGVQRGQVRLRGAQYSAILDKRTCPLCERQDEMILAIQDTDLTKFAPPVHHNCLPGDALVLPGSKITGASKRVYEGEMVRVRTLRGHQLTGTPNHPVLTDRGWIGLGSLQQGDHLISRTGADWMDRSGDDRYDVPTRIEEVAEAILSSGQVSAREVPVTAEDFHGDGVGSQVAVVRSDGLLRDALDAPLCQQHRELVLAGTREVTSGVHLSGEGSGVLLGVSAGAPQAGGVCGIRPLSALLGAGVGHALGHGGGAASAFHSGVQQATGDDAAAQAEVGGDGQFALASGVTPHDVLDVESGLGAYGHALFGGVAQGAAGVGDASADDDVRDAETARDARDSLAGFVAADDVVEVERYEWTGHVYNLETVGGWYMANGIATSNCRCTYVWITEQEEDFKPTWSSPPPSVVQANGSLIVGS